ncbi:MAG: thiol-disulfide oxidoreductase DCC family protein [Candidatus Kapaibacterium sp.]
MPDFEFPILFFDGCCPFCNFVVRMIYRLDRRGILRFAPIESGIGQAAIERHPEMKAVDSAFILDYDERGAEHISAKSDMLARLAGYIEWPGKILLLPFKLLPRKWGDCLYDLVARNRSRWFGRYESCSIPPTGLRERFLPNRL